MVDANLRKANLMGVDIRFADLCGADLCGGRRWNQTIRAYHHGHSFDEDPRRMTDP